MIQVGELGLEIKCGIFFSIIAFILSILTGLIASVPLERILLRVLLMVPVFFVVGLGLVQVLKKYVPEVYEVVLNPKAASEDSSVDIEISPDISENAISESTEKSDSGFSEFTEKDYDRLQSVRDSSLDNTLNASNGKLGKHIIVENQFNEYEPKLMAQAIRTMMSKDKD